MKKYTVKTGDTLPLISRLQYGRPGFESVIQSANPSITEPLTVGQVLNIPDKQDQVPLALPDAPQISEQDQVSIAIGNEIFTFFEDVSISRQLDSLDSFSFSAPFEPSQQNIREAFQPFTYKTVTVYVGDKPEFTGTMFVTPQLSDVRTIGVSGYALPGVLNDCNSSISDFPIEFNGQNLQSITNALIKPFGLSAIFLDEEGANFVPEAKTTFDRVAPKESEKIYSFLAKLAQQRKQIISNNELGNLVFQLAALAGNPVQRLTDGSSPVLSITPSFDEQSYFSSVSGIAPSDLGESGGNYTVNNPFLEGVLRPFTFTANDADDSTLKSIVDYKMSLMFGNVISYQVTVNTWRDSKGNLWKPNTTIVLNAPNVMIYEDYEFLIRGVDLARGVSGNTAVLDIVLPGSFSGILPERLPWL